MVVNGDELPIAHLSKKKSQINWPIRLWDCLKASDSPTKFNGTEKVETY